MTGPEQSTTRKSFLGDVGVGDIKIVVTIILILDLINQVTNIWDQIVTTKEAVLTLMRRLSGDSS